ncbi:hypothetical protein ALC62_09519 [Cyphomyrmex costatus]|uniref:Uncharacterized protein n=1 Tax=Cyphomyrmex costatus TaxID=456900 RepID=A0A195CIK6_9HYME|nr:hypothetical protein ALC62_09519 [Cyphomyrmex costatus]
MYTCAWIAVRGVIKVVNFILTRIWIRFRVCSPARNDGTSENKVTSYCFKEQEGQATLACAGIAILTPLFVLRRYPSDGARLDSPKNPRMCLQLRPLRNHFGAKPPSPTRIPRRPGTSLNAKLRLARRGVGRERRGRCGYATVGSARSLSRKSDALVITCSHEYSIARGIINSSNVIKTFIHIADSRNDYPSNLSRTYLPRPALGPRSLKLTEVVPSLKLAPRSTEASEDSAFSTHKTTLSQEHSDARTPPVRYPFTGSSTSANAGFRSQWQESALIKCFNIAWIFMRLLRAQGPADVGLLLHHCERTYSVWSRNDSVQRRVAGAGSNRKREWNSGVEWRGGEEKEKEERTLAIRVGGSQSPRTQNYIDYNTHQQLISQELYLYAMLAHALQYSAECTITNRNSGPLNDSEQT